MLTIWNHNSPSSTHYFLWSIIFCIKRSFWINQKQIIIYRENIRFVRYEIRLLDMKKNILKGRKRGQWWFASYNDNKISGKIVQKTHCWFTTDIFLLNTFKWYKVYMFSFILLNYAYSNKRRVFHGDNIFIENYLESIFFSPFLIAANKINKIRNTLFLWCHTHILILF